MSKETYANVFENYKFEERSVQVQGIGVIISYVHNPIFDEQKISIDAEIEREKEAQSEINFQSTSESKVINDTITGNTSNMKYKTEIIPISSTICDL